MTKSLIFVPLFIGIAMWSIYNVAEINKVTMNRGRGSVLNLTKGEWRLIGKHFLYLLSGYIVFGLCILLVYSL